MPAVEKRDRKQKAVLWPSTQVNDYGQVTVSDTGREVDVRWNNVLAEAVDAQGNSVKIDAEAVVGEPIMIGSLMWLGRLVDYDGTNVMQTISYDATLDLKGRVARRQVKLMRFKGQVPTVAPIPRYE